MSNITKIFTRLTAVSILVCLQFISFSVHATPVCTTDSVTLNHIEIIPSDGNNVIWTGSKDATSCAGLFPGNDDQGGLSNPNPNIGHENDGLLNGENGVLDPLTFIDSSDLQDLDNDGIFSDPGWVHLANIQQTGTNTDYSGNAVNYSKLGGDSGLELADFLDIRFNCDSTECTAGTWSLETLPGIFEEVQAILGENSFDHLAFALKAGNEQSGGGWAVYDFDFTELAPDLGDFNFVTPYYFEGTWNMDDFGYKKPKQFSHINVWARDPSNSSKVPLPATLLLLLPGLIALRAINRKF